VLEKEEIEREKKEEVECAYVVVCTALYVQYVCQDLYTNQSVKSKVGENPMNIHSHSFPPGLLQRTDSKFIQYIHFLLDSL
jgi:hypothetical protein